MAVEIYVHEGEYAGAGQELFAMEYDNGENEWKLQEIAALTTKEPVRPANIHHMERLSRAYSVLYMDRGRY